MPKPSTSTRGDHDREVDDGTKSKSSIKSSKNDGNEKRSDRSKRDRRESKISSQNGEKSRSADGAFEGASNRPADSSFQEGNSGLPAVPGQYYDEVVVGTSGGKQSNPNRPPEHEAMSSYVQDQFPGQFPSESAEPYRPPLAANEGGPGLATDYYGDTGQSVSEQPGFRKQSPSLIIGQEPHLLPASSVAAPPPEPSASGGVGAAASFFSGEFDADETASSHVQQTSSAYSSAPTRPNAAATPSNMSSLESAAIVSTASTGAAAAYAVGNHPSSSQQQHTTSTTGPPSGNTTMISPRPQAQPQSSYYSASSRPPPSGSRPSHADNIPIYAAAAASVAGLAGAALHSGEHPSAGQASSSQHYATTTTPRHRYRGPLGALVDFVKDPEGVARFEEYSEYVGICRGCFEPGSSPRDAPRRHRAFNRKRSDERIGRASRVEKSRRDSSGDEKRDRNSPSWLSGGLAGYGLGKMGEGLFNYAKDFDDTYSIKSGRHVPENGGKYRERWASDEKTRRRRRREEVLEIGVTGDGNFSTKKSDILGVATSKHSQRRQGRSSSRNRETNNTGATINAKAGLSTSGLSSRQSRSSDHNMTKSRRGARNELFSDDKRTSHRRKGKENERKGFFNFGSNSSSSNLDLHSRDGKTLGSKHEDEKAEAALLGLGAAAVALAAADGRSNRQKNGVKELVGRKETSDERFQRPSAEDEGWEDEEDYRSEVGTVDSGLAFGGDSDASSGYNRDRRRRREMSGKGSLPRRRPSWDDERPTRTGSLSTLPIATEVASATHFEENSRRERPSSPLQYVEPVPIPDFQHLDERMEASKPFSSRPPLVSHPSENTPFHQPQPKARVSSSIYTTQVPFSQNSTPTAGPIDKFTSLNRVDESYEANMNPKLNKDFELSRRATLPARFESEDAPNEAAHRHKPSVKDDMLATSGVRFALPENDGDERREKRRSRKESQRDNRVDRGRRAEDDEGGREKERTPRKNSDARRIQIDGPINTSSSSWDAPAAVGLMGAAMGAAAVVASPNDSKAEETKDQRRERRRRERLYENEDGSCKERRRKEKGTDLEELPNKIERRRDGDSEETREERKARRRRERKERERKEREKELSLENEVLTPSTPHVSFGTLPRRIDGGGEDEIGPDKQEPSSKQEGYRHESYSSFFTPAIDDTSDQQVKIFGANADADISFDQSPNFVIAEPRKFRDQSGTPEFSPADTVDKIDRSLLRFPWQIPRLRLLYPTPPSTRGSTPIIEPKEIAERANEEISEIEPVNDTSSVGIEQRDSHGDYEVLPMESPEVNDRYTDPPSDEESQRLRRRKPKKIPLSIDREDTPPDVGSYVNDNSFAAVLAASAQDAGFDPSIVIDNPKYRRRESPPGSSETNVRSSLEEEEGEPRPGTSKRKDRTFTRQGAPKERDDDSILKGIPAQAETKGSGKTTEDPNTNVKDLVPAKSKKLNKLKKGSRRSTISDEPSEDRDSPVADDKDELEDEQKVKARSVIAYSTSSYDDGICEESQSSNRNDDLASKVGASVALASVSEAGTNPKASGRKKGSIWNRVLGKTADKLSGPGEDGDVKREDTGELSRSDSKEGQKSKQMAVQSVPNLEYGMGKEPHSDQNEESEANRSVILPSESGAQYLTRESDPEQSQEPVTESFLGERPDPPPPPDIQKSSKEPFDVVTAIYSQEKETQTSSDTHSSWLAEIGMPDDSLSPKAVSSPTAVPIHFRRRPLPRARSSSQSPLSSARAADDGPQPHPPRPRPRSTQFENSKEYRPLWLVERNQSRQEAPRDETYPPLPSSHSTSRDSSIDSFNRQRELDIAERTFESKEDDQGLSKDTGSPALQSDLLDSQQPTPTVSSFQDISATQSQPSPPSSRPGSPSKDRRIHNKHASSNFEHASLAAVVGGNVAHAIFESDGDHGSSIQKHPEPESAKLNENLEDWASQALQVRPTNPGKSEDLALQKMKKKGNKEKPPNNHLAEEHGIAITHVLETFDKEGDSPYILPKQMAANEENVRSVQSNELAEPATISTEESELVIDLHSNKVPTDDMGVSKAPSELIEREITTFNDPTTHSETSKSKQALTDTHVDLMNLSDEPPHDHEKETEFSPISTPLPEGDDSSLFDEPSRSNFEKSLEPSAKEIIMPTGKTVEEHHEQIERLVEGRESPPMVLERSQNEKNLAPSDSRADGQNIEKHKDTPYLQDVPQNDGDLTNLGNKKRSQKSKKNAVSLGEQDQSALNPIHPIISEHKDPNPADFVEGDPEENQSYHEDIRIWSREEPSHEAYIIPTVLKEGSYKLSSDKGDSKEINDQHQVRVSHGDEPPQVANSMSQEVQNGLNRSQTDDSLDLNSNVHRTIDEAINVVAGTHEDDNAGSLGDHDGITILTQGNHDSEVLGALSESTETAVPAQNVHEDTQYSLHAENHHLDARQEMGDDSLTKPAGAYDLDLDASNDENDMKARKADDPFIGMPGNPMSIENPEPADLKSPDDKVVEDEYIGALPIKKSKKDRKSKKSRKEETLVTDKPTLIESVGTLTLVPTMVHEAPKIAKDQDSGNAVVKSSKKEKKKNRKTVSNLTTHDPVEQLNDDVGSGLLESAAEAHDINFKPVAFQENDIPPSSEQGVSALSEIEEHDWDNGSVKKTKKDKKGKKSASISTIATQIPESLEDSTPDTTKTRPENKELADNQSLQVAAVQPDTVNLATSVEVVNESDRAEGTQKEAPYDESFGAPKNKKGKKEAKKSKKFPWDDDANQQANNEDVVTKLEASNQVFAPMDATQKVDDVSIKPSVEAQGTQQEKYDSFTIPERLDGGIELHAGKDLSWGAYRSKGSASQDPSLAPESLGADFAPEGGKGSDTGNIATKQSPPLQQETDRTEDIPSLKAEELEEKPDRAQSQSPAWDGKEPIEDKTSPSTEKADQKSSESSTYVRADAIETPQVERAQSSFNIASPVAGPVVLPVQSPDDVPEQLTFDDIVEPSTVEEPCAFQAQEELPKSIREDSIAEETEGTNLNEELVIVKKSERGKKLKKVKTGDLDSMEQKSIDREQNHREDQIGQEIDPKENDVSIIERHQAYTYNDRGSGFLDALATSKIKNIEESIQINADEPEIIERLDHQSLKASTQKKSSPPGTPLSAGSVDMLDADQQREYNEEYQKQLQKELSPLRDDNGVLDSKDKIFDDNDHKEPERPLEPSVNGDQTLLITDLADPQVLNRDMARETDQSILSTTDINRHQSSLSAIPEEREPQSNSSSLQKAPTDTIDQPERNKGKKGKKSKQLHKYFVREDGTATQGLAGDAEQSPDDPVSGLVDDNKPHQENWTVYENLPSPTRGSPSTSRPPIYDDAAEDYFAVKPRAQAEKDVGRDAGSGYQSQPLQSSQIPVAARGDELTASEQKPPRERSPSRERRSPKDPGFQDLASQVSPFSRDEGSASSDRLETVREVSVAAVTGAGIIGATAVAKDESKKAKRDKKNKRRAKKISPESNEDEGNGEHNDALIDIPQRHEFVTKSDRIPGQSDDTPPQSPGLSNGLRHPHEGSQQEEYPNYRDSAIQISDSPVIPAPEPIHRPQHDSGYPATEASPVIKDGNEDIQEEREVVDPCADPRISTTGFYREHEDRPASITSGPRHGIVESDDQDQSSDRRTSRRRRRRRESNVTYDSDDSNDSGYDKQRRLRKIRQAEEIREPSPVSSTTKNRSSVLFNSSPSDRQILDQHRETSGNITDTGYIHDEHPPVKDSSLHDGPLIMAEHANFELGDDPQRSQELPKSIFGGPLKEEEKSRSRSPTNSDTRSRRQLEKISEDNLENSPLARKGKRDIGDVGSPDSGVKARRTSHDLSPLVTGVTAEAATIGSEDPFKRLRKTSKDEDDQSVDTERSKIRDQDRPRRLSNQSNTSSSARDNEWRRQAIKSPDSIHAIIRTPPDQVRSSSGQSVRSSGTPPLRRVDRSVSGDLRGASKEMDAKRRAKMAEAEPAILGVVADSIPSSSTYDPLTDKGKHRSDMADVYEGDGRRGQSPMSPTRPPSMRKRQSLQFADLEQRFEQLAADHRSLQNAKSAADRRLDEQARDHSQQRQTYEEALRDHKSYLAEKDSELNILHEILDGFKRQVADLTMVNEELQTSRGLDPDRLGDQSFQILASQHETTKKELEDLREQHTRLANDHEDMLEREIEAVRQEKDHELQQLIVELENAKEEVRALQQQILASQSTDDYVEHDEDYFEGKCTALCQHVQQWVLRFSKFSDSHACRLIGELGDDTISDLYDDAILDGTEVDDYLQDRIKRRDVFMSVVMSRIFDFIFRRYLFGLDREQRKKLKDLDATLMDVGSQSAVHKWRSTTLTLLSSRPEFADQREEDTEGVLDSIYQTLAAILPPKRDLVPQIIDSLRRVVAMAVDLHIEMRLQRAEFQMLPPLKPQFDPNTGDLVRKVPFNATMMNERSGTTDSNDQLQEEGAAVRMILFPLVVKNSDDEEQIIVCPAQVIVAKDGVKKKGNGKQVRVMSAQGARSEVSFAGTDDTRMSVEGGIF